MVRGQLKKEESKYEKYIRIRRKYLSLGITLKDLFYYFEMGRRVSNEKKKRIEKVIKKQGLTETLIEFWKWMDLAEEINPEELTFLYE